MQHGSENQNLILSVPYKQSGVCMGQIHFASFKIFPTCCESSNRSVRKNTFEHIYLQVHGTLWLFVLIISN